MLHIGTVLEQRSKRDRRDALETLSHSLEKAFENTIDRILHQSKPLVSQARKLLTWIHLAERPLMVDELLEALAIREGDNELDRSGLLGRATLLDCCLGLATIDTETSTVRLVHFSLREYLEKKDEILGQQIVDGHTLIARTCLTCLMFYSVTEDISPQSTTDSEDEESMIVNMSSQCTSDSEGEKDMTADISPQSTTDSEGKEREPGASGPSYTFLNYAACQWGCHLQKSGQREDSAVVLARKYLCMNTGKRYWSQRHLYDHLKNVYNHMSARRLFDASFSKLHIAAYFGIHYVLAGLEFEAPEVNSKDSDGWTPLSWAIERMNLEFIQWLLGKDAEMNYSYKIDWDVSESNRNLMDLR